MSIRRALWKQPVAATLAVVLSFGQLMPSASAATTYSATADAQSRALITDLLWEPDNQATVAKDRGPADLRRRIDERFGQLFEEQRFVVAAGPGASTSEARTQQIEAYVDELARAFAAYQQQVPGQQPPERLAPATLATRIQQAVDRLAEAFAEVTVVVDGKPTAALSMLQPVLLLTHHEDPALSQLLDAEHWSWVEHERQRAPNGPRRVPISLLQLEAFTDHDALVQYLSILAQSLAEPSGASPDAHLDVQTVEDFNRTLRATWDLHKTDWQAHHDWFVAVETPQVIDDMRTRGVKAAVGSIPTASPQGKGDDAAIEAAVAHLIFTDVVYRDRAPWRDLDQAKLDAALSARGWEPERDNPTVWSSRASGDSEPADKESRVVQVDSEEERVAWGRERAALDQEFGRRVQVSLGQAEVQWKILEELEGELVRFDVSVPEDSRIAHIIQTAPEAAVMDRLIHTISRDPEQAKTILTRIQQDPRAAMQRLETRFGQLHSSLWWNPPAGLTDAELLELDALLWCTYEHLDYYVFAHNSDSKYILPFLVDLAAISVSDRETIRQLFAEAHQKYRRTVKWRLMHSFPWVKAFRVYHGSPTEFYSGDRMRVAQPTYFTPYRAGAEMFARDPERGNEPQVLEVLIPLEAISWTGAGVLDGVPQGVEHDEFLVDPGDYPILSGTERQVATQAPAMPIASVDESLFDKKKIVSGPMSETESSLGSAQSTEAREAAAIRAALDALGPMDVVDLRGPVWKPYPTHPGFPSEMVRPIVEANARFRRDTEDGVWYRHASGDSEPPAEPAQIQMEESPPSHFQESRKPLARQIAVVKGTATVLAAASAITSGVARPPEASASPLQSPPALVALSTGQIVGGMAKSPAAGAGGQSARVASISAPNATFASAQVESHIKGLANPGTRTSALQALVKISTPAVSQLIQTLKNPHASIRALAAKTLGQIGDPRAIEPLLQACLKDSSEAVRTEAATALAEHFKPDQLPLKQLYRALRAEEPETRKRAAWVLGRLEDPEAVPSLNRARSRETDPSVRRVVVWALGRNGDLAAEALIKALQDEHADVRLEAVQALRPILLGELWEAEAREALARAATDPDPRVRLESVMVLGSKPHPNIHAVLVRRLVEDDDEQVQVQAARLLGQFRSANARSALLEALRALTKANRSVAAKEVVAALSEWPASAGPVIQMLATADPALKMHLNEILRRMGPVAVKQVSPSIAAEFLTGAPSVSEAALGSRITELFGQLDFVDLDNAQALRKRRAAIDALVQLGSPVVKSLADPFAIGDQDAAAEILGRIGDPAGLPILIKILKRETTTQDDPVGKAAIRAVIGFGDRAVGLLLEALHESAHDWRRFGSIAQALGRIGHPDAIQPLIEFLKLDYKENINEEAARALEWLGKPAAGPLIDALQKPGYSRYMISGALGSLGHPDAAAPLVRTLFDQDLMLRILARDALIKIGAPTIGALLDAFPTDDIDVRRHIGIALEEIAGTSDVVAYYIDWLGRQPVTQRSSVQRELLELLQRCQRLKQPIRVPFRFQLKVLKELVANREHVTPDDRPIAVVIYAQKDHNRVFHHDQAVGDLIENGYRVMYYEVLATKENRATRQIAAIMHEAAQSSKSGRVKGFMLGGHGAQDKLSYGARDPGVDDITDVDEAEFLDVGDKQELTDLNIAAVVEKGGWGILNTCSGGKGKAGAANLANLFRQVIPHIRAKGIFSATAPVRVPRLQFDNQHELLDIKWQFAPGGGETYRAFADVERPWAPRHPRTIILTSAPAKWTFTVSDHFAKSKNPAAVQQMLSHLNQFVKPQPGIEERQAQETVPTTPVENSAQQITEAIPKLQTSGSGGRRQATREQAIEELMEGAQSAPSASSVQAAQLFQTSAIHDALEAIAPMDVVDLRGPVWHPYPTHPGFPSEAVRPIVEADPQFLVDNQDGVWYKHASGDTEPPVEPARQPQPNSPQTKTESVIPEDVAPYIEELASATVQMMMDDLDETDEAATWLRLWLWTGEWQEPDAAQRLQTLQDVIGTERLIQALQALNVLDEELALHDGYDEEQPPTTELAEVLWAMARKEPLAGRLADPARLLTLLVSKEPENSPWRNAAEQLAGKPDIVAEALQVFSSRPPIFEFAGPSELIKFLVVYDAFTHHAQSADARLLAVDLAHQLAWNLEDSREHMWTTFQDELRLSAEGISLADLVSWNEWLVDATEPLELDDTKRLSIKHAAEGHREAILRARKLHQFIDAFVSRFGEAPADPAAFDALTQSLLNEEFDDRSRSIGELPSTADLDDFSELMMDRSLPELTRRLERLLGANHLLEQAQLGELYEEFSAQVSMYLGHGPSLAELATVFADALQPLAQPLTMELVQKIERAPIGWTVVVSLPVDPDALKALLASPSERRFSPFTASDGRALCVVTKGTTYQTYEGRDIGRRRFAHTDLNLLTDYSFFEGHSHPQGGRPRFSDRDREVNEERARQNQGGAKEFTGAFMVMVDRSGQLHGQYYDAESGVMHDLDGDEATLAYLTRIGMVAPQPSAVLAPDETGHDDAAIDAAVGIAQQRLRAMIDRAGITSDKAAASDKAARKQVIDAYNVEVGGVPGFIAQGAVPAAADAPVSIPVAADNSQVVAHLQATRDGQCAWGVFGAGRATRMRMPAAFDRLGIAGLTRRILRLLPRATELEKPDDRARFAEAYVTLARQFGGRRITAPEAAAALAAEPSVVLNNLELLAEIGLAERLASPESDEVAYQITPVADAATLERIATVLRETDKGKIDAMRQQLVGLSIELLDGFAAAQRELERAASGVVEHDDDLSFVQRQLLQLRYGLERAIREAPEAGITLDELLAGARFVVIVNEENREAIARQLAAVGFGGLKPEQIFLVEQEEVGGYKLLADGSLQWQDEERWPEGHGDPPVAMAQRPSTAYHLDRDGKAVPLGQPLAPALRTQGVKRLMLTQVNDLHLLTDMFAASRWAVADALMRDGRIKMVLEAVDNDVMPGTTQRQKGAPIFIRPDGTVILRDPPALQTPELAAYGFPEIMSRMFFFFDIEALAGLTDDSLPSFINEREARDGRPVLTREVYSGDLTTAMPAKAIKQHDFALNTFKLRARIPAALATMASQDAQDGFGAMLDDVLGQPTPTNESAPNKRDQQQERPQRDEGVAESTSAATAVVNPEQRQVMMDRAAVAVSPTVPVAPVMPAPVERAATPAKRSWRDVIRAQGLDPDQLLEDLEQAAALALERQRVYTLIDAESFFGSPDVAQVLTALQEAMDEAINRGHRRPGTMGRQTALPIGLLLRKPPVNPNTDEAPDPKQEAKKLAAKIAERMKLEGKGGGEIETDARLNIELFSTFLWAPEDEQGAHDLLNQLISRKGGTEPIPLVGAYVGPSDRAALISNVMSPRQPSPVQAFGFDLTARDARGAITAIARGIVEAFTHAMGVAAAAKREPPPSEGAIPLPIIAIEVMPLDGELGSFQTEIDEYREKMQAINVTRKKA